ncbi:MAG: hypothetical protein IJU69_04690 [Bacteroidales bacterium]|nr:hypothetical protein [Bacteroidales bacterium]
MRKFFLLLASALLLCPLATQAQNKKKLNVKLPSANVATIKFNADNPSAKENRNTAGTPWEKVSSEPVALPAGVKAAIPKPLPDISKISAIEYNMAVSVAFESLRIIYGDMSEKDAETFMAMWAPLFNNPSKETIDYMNKLNPLLSQFIVARESYINSLANVELLYLDASEALEWDDKDAFKSAMFQANLYTRTLKQLEAAMSELANRIQALGNPPNPFEQRQLAAARYRRVFKPKEVYLGETWMGTRIDQKHQVEGLEPLTEPMMRYLMKVKVKGKDRWFVLELKEDPSIKIDPETDPQGVGNVKVEQMYFSDHGYLMPDFKSDGNFQTYYPKPPVMAITALTVNLLRQHSMSELTSEDKKNPSYADRKRTYHELAGHYGARVLRSGVFFKTAILWAQEDKFNSYEWKDDGVVPFKLIDDFEEAFKKQAAIEAANANKLPKLQLFGGKKSGNAQAGSNSGNSANPSSTQQMATSFAAQDSLAREEQSKKESIAWREENIKLIENNIRRDEEGRRKAQSRLAAAKTPQERQWIQQEIDDYDRRIMYQRSDIQNERDNIRQLQTGQFVHTRTEFEQYANAKMIHDAKVEAERYIQTKKAAAIIDRQINRLPEDERDAARARAEKMFYDDGALANGDIEKVQKLASAFNNKIMAKELKIQSEAQDEIAWADLKEAGANATIMACGSLTVGLAGEALAAAYGAGAASASTMMWGPKVIGAVYGGVTGYVAGGPGRAASSAAGYFHPVTGAVASFLEGYTAEGSENMSVYQKMWNGCKQAGTDFLIGKAFEVGAKGIAKTASAILPDGIVRFNLTKGMTNFSRKKADIIRTQRERLEAEDAVKSFAKLCDDYANPKGKTIEQMVALKKQINQTAAAMNSDYHAKWYMKYKADPLNRARFDQAVQINYDEMTPKMTQSLTKQGYDMSDIQFKQFRNSSSSGSSSMDLDLAPVSKTTGAEPVFYKNGQRVTAAQFMKDAQNTMNKVYHDQHHISAKASEMNLTTSAHPEAYGTAELLKKDVDYSKLKAEDIASIGKVLESKVNTIEGNVRFSETTKLQAKSREATKEIDNMLIPKLKQQLKATKNKKDIKQLNADIAYWQDMSKRLGQIGKQTSNPYEIHRLNNEIQRETGGKDAIQVVNDLIREFNPSFKP